MEQERIYFPIDGTETWHGAAGEYLWSSPLVSGGYQIDSIPFFLTDIALGDVVEAERVDGVLEFRALRLRGGHCCYRIALTPGGSLAAHLRVDKLVSHVQSLGCQVERGEICGVKLFAIDVPREVSAGEVYDSLLEAKALGLVEMEVAYDERTD